MRKSISFYVPRICRWGFSFQNTYSNRKVKQIKKILQMKEIVCSWREYSGYGKAYSNLLSFKKVDSRGSHASTTENSLITGGVSSFSAPISVLLQYQHPWGCYSEENKETVVLLAVTILWKQSCLMSRNQLAVCLGWEWGKGWHTSNTNSALLIPLVLEMRNLEAGRRQH